MDRWTIKELKEISTLDFAISILRERRSKVTPYSPLGIKLDKTIAELNNINLDRFNSKGE